jgi:hypothetical protein
MPVALWTKTRPRRDRGANGIGHAIRLALRREHSTGLASFLILAAPVYVSRWALRKAMVLLHRFASALRAAAASIPSLL